MSSANLELICESKSSRDFPMVALYLNKEIGPIILNENDVSFFTKKVEMVNNFFEVPRTMDILSGIEITGKFANHSSITEIYSKIKSIDIEIGDEIITRIYLKNEICNILMNDYFYTIHIPFDKLLYNVGYIPVVGLRYNHIKIHVLQYYGNKDEYDCYLMGAILNSDIRKIYLKEPIQLLYKDFHKYDGKINGNQIKIVNEFGVGLSSTNIISSLYFDFGVNIRSRLKYIELKNGNDRSITMIPLSQIHFIGNYQIIIDKFYYKAFLFNSVVIEFGLTIPFFETTFTLITTNYNMLVIGNGFGAKAFNNLSRSIDGDGNSAYAKIPEDIYQKKVVPKADNICAISHTEFADGEIRIVSGCCFSIFRRQAIEMWFHSKKKKLCPCCRVEDGEWWRV